jgi:hypothetical protein
MKKLLLLIVILFGITANAQTLITEDFNSLTTGNVSTSFTGATVGQGGWFLYSTNGAAPTTTTSANVNNAQIVSSSLQLSGPNGDKGGSFVYKGGLPALWSARTVGNNIIEVEVDVTRGANSTSINVFGVYIYDSTGSKVLSGFTINASTGEINLVLYTTPSGYPVNNYTYSLAAVPGIIFPANTTGRMGIAFNKTTGQVRIKGPGISAAGLTITGSAAGIDPDEIDFIAFSGTTLNTTNTSSSTMIFDNFMSRASATDTLLGINNSEAISNKFSVFPNPTTGIINVSNADGINVSEITVTDLNGRVVKTNKFDSVSNIQINISDLSKGMYMMNIKSDQGTAIKKVFKD